MPTATILLSTFYGEKYLAELLESVIHQTYSDWVLLIRDDCSTDQTVRIIQSYVDKYPGKILFIKGDENLGPTESFNSLASLVKTDYAMFCDQDDVWDPNKIEISLNAIQELEASFSPTTPIVCFSDLSLIDGESKPIHSSYWKYSGTNPHRTRFRNLLWKSVSPGCAMIFNRALMELATPIPKKAVMHDYWFLLVASAFGIVHSIPKQLVNYRQHDNNTLGAYKKSRRFTYSKYWNSLVLGLEIDEYSARFLQAQEFFNRYGKKIDPSKRKDIARFLKISKAISRKRTLLLLQYKILALVKSAKNL